MCDSHIHLALSPLKENWKRDTNDFLTLGGKKILTQGTEFVDFQETFNLAEKINNYFDKNIVDLAIGIHPTIFDEKFANEETITLFERSKKFVSKFQEIFEKEKRKLSAVGETGLDYFQMYNLGLDKEKIEALKKIQQESFKLHVQLSKESSLPMSIHAREKNNSSECTKDVLSILAKHGNGMIQGVFHSYTGEKENLSDILDMGFYIGFNAIITYPSGGNVREIIKMTPIDRIIFETDGPFLATQSVRRDKKAEVRYGRSSQIKEIIETAAEIKNVTYEKIEKISDENYEKIFKQA